MSAGYETGSRRPDAATTAKLCRTPHQAGRVDLAEIFAAVLPGVQEGLLVPVWRLPQAERPAEPVEEPAAPKRKPESVRMKPLYVDVEVTRQPQERFEVVNGIVRRVKPSGGS